jgi:hypothetical protein
VGALIAAPVVLSKKADESPAPAPAPKAQAKKQSGPEELAQVKLDDAIGKGNGSSLSSFDTSNPFAPPDKVVKAAQDETATDNGTAGTAPTDTGTLTPSTGTETGTGGGGDTTTGGGTPQTGGGGTPKTAEFNYVLDVTFWANGRKRTIEGLKKLAMLPNQVAPLLIFMGVTDNAGNAVFLVDSTLKATGEGKCKPSHADCAFLYLGAGSEEEFTNADGDSYRLVINEIRKVKAGSQTAATTSSQKAGASARAAVGAPESARRFSVPDLTDLVVESTDGTDNSTGADARR